MAIFNVYELIGLCVFCLFALSLSSYRLKTRTICAIKSFQITVNHISLVNRFICTKITIFWILIFFFILNEMAFLLMHFCWFGCALLLYCCCGFFYVIVCSYDKYIFETREKKEEKNSICKIKCCWLVLVEYCGKCGRRKPRPKQNQAKQILIDTA